jgi:hypothetical protein
VHRIDAETLTDRVLATTERLDDALYGPAIAVREDDTGQVSVDGQRRRSLYLQQRRSQPVALLQAFDAPVMQTNCESRPSSTVATQSLMLMNGDFMLEHADRLAFFSSMTGSPYWPATLPADLPALPQPLPSLWQFGYGAYDAGTQRTGSFTPLAHWTGSDWQGGAERPDPQIGWVGLNPAGGHPGENPNFCAIRRWTAPTDGTLTLTGTLGHANENGDGVRGRIVVSRSGIAGEWPVHNSSTPTVAESIAVSQGDTVDLIVDCREHVTSDPFTWPVQFVLSRDGAELAKWASPDGFHGPLQSFQPLHPGNIVRAWQRAYLRNPSDAELRAGITFVTAQVESMRLNVTSLPHGRTPEYQALVNLCQALLVSNEFLYVE